jgi:monooxygenase
VQLLNASSPEHFDVLIVGAGISGIDAAYHVQESCPGRRYEILEARDSIGGTWDLFRYPGIRSDSDMATLGFPFRPWRSDRTIVDGPSILRYVEETARAFCIDRHIRFRHKVTKASWASKEARWTVETETPEGPLTFRCNFLYLCSGYYDFENGYRPEWPGEKTFRGRIVHPQHWSEDLDYSEKHVVVIGSGATAITLVPSMAGKAAHVTMLQRSPSYIVSRPSRDRLAAWARKRLPQGMADRLVRWKNVLLGIGFYSLARRRPETVRRMILKGVEKQLPEGYDVERDFSPHYNVWDQRLCLVPDADLFRAIGEGRAAIATDHIERFTADGIRLQSGEELQADIVVTATGLVIKLMGGIEFMVEGEPIEVAERLTYKGMMLEGVPNMAFALGYTNASWTLKCDLTSQYVCRLLRHMERHGYDVCVPRLRENVEKAPLLDFTSGYVQRAAGRLPSQGSKAPWRLHQNYLLDYAALKLGKVEDVAMEFHSKG